MDVRNDYVKTYLRADKTVSFDVFCVSNTQYSGLKGRSELHTMPQLSAEDTGIPGLREWILTFPAAGIWRATRAYIEHRFAVFLMGVEIWANAQPIKDHEKLVGIVQKPQEVSAGSTLRFHNLIMAGHPSRSDEVYRGSCFRSGAANSEVSWSAEMVSRSGCGHLTNRLTDDEQDQSIEHASKQLNKWNKVSPDKRRPVCVCGQWLT